MSAPSCPQEAVAEAVKLAEKGEHVSKKLAQQLIRQYTVAPDPLENEEMDDDRQQDVGRKTVTAECNWRDVDWSTAECVDDDAGEGDAPYGYVATDDDEPAEDDTEDG